MLASFEKLIVLNQNVAQKEENECLRTVSPSLIIATTFLTAGTERIWTATCYLHCAVAPLRILLHDKHFSLSEPRHCALFSPRKFDTEIATFKLFLTDPITHLYGDFILFSRVISHSALWTNLELRLKASSMLYNFSCF